MPTRRPEFDDGTTEPLWIVTDDPPVGHGAHSMADRVVAALSVAPPASAEPLLTTRQLRLLLIVLLAGTVATSIAFAFHPGGPILAGHDTPLDTRSGDCLAWPDGIPDQVSVVDCANDHLFEVAAPVDVKSLGDQPGLDPDRQLEQTFQQACPAAADRYLGNRLDPGGRFVVGMLWSPNDPRPQSGGRLVCGLQLRGDGNASKPFRGRIADQDQSNVWPSGTCLGIDRGQSTDIPVDCSADHAMEVVGTANLADDFADAPPSIAEQDAAVRNLCNTKTKDYLSPRPLAETTLTLHYTPVSDAGWAAGSRWIACRLASMEPDGRWATLRGSARSELSINGLAPAPVDAPVAVVPTETVVNAGATTATPEPPPPTQAPPPEPSTDAGLPPAPGDVAAPPPSAEPLPPAVASEAPAAPPEPTPPPPPPPPAQGPLPGPPPEQQTG